jgi:hypothetical protein
MRPMRRVPARAVRLNDAITVALFAVTVGLATTGQAVGAARLASVPASSNVSANVDADALLEDVIARLPREPITLTGQLFVRLPRGIPVRDLAFDMHLDYAATPSSATYTLRSSSGVALERLTVTRDARGVAAFSYARGDPPVSAVLERLCVPVQQTDVTWMDLTLSFLWWRGGVWVGSDSIRGRPTIVVDVSPPAGDPAAETYARVRLWIDEQARILLQAEGYDAAGKPVRTLWVKSFRKINERWMIKDMEIQQYPVVHRTKLRVNDVDDTTAPVGGAPR